MNLKEIAKAAGVSPSAVSLVLNGKSGVGVQKRAQVTQLLLSNGYSIAPRQSLALIHSGRGRRLLK